MLTLSSQSPSSIAESLCPCGSLLAYVTCCGRYHSGAQFPATAVDLMRSRFSAFALRNADYLLQTWDERTRPAALSLETDASLWQTLEIINTDKGGANDSAGQVEFIAYYALNGADYVLHERSRFNKLQGRWLYVNGVIKAHGLRSAKVKQGQNAPCACGSGKKYKRCCG